METIPPDVFARKAQALDHDRFVAFVDAARAASGWETATSGPVVVARTGGRETRLLVLPHGPLARYRKAPDTRQPVDAVVSPRVVEDGDDLPRNTPDVQVIDVTDLRRRLLYGMSNAAGKRLATEFLGVPLRDEQWATAESDRVDALRERVTPDGSGPSVSRRTTLGLLGAGVLGGVGYSTLGGFDGGVNPEAVAPARVPSPDDRTPGTFGSGGQSEPSTQFSFEADEQRLRVSHVGGDGIAAESLFLVGGGFTGEPEIQWSELDQFEYGEVVTAGDTLSVGFDPPGLVRTMWENDGDRTELGRYRTPGPTGEVEEPPDSAGFEVTHGSGQVRLVYTGEVPIDPSNLVVRGTDFEGAPSVTLDYEFEDGNNIAPGKVLTFDATDSVVIRVEWTTIRGEILLGSYTGPGRPLTDLLDGVKTENYDALNTGFASDTWGPTVRPNGAWMFQSNESIWSMPTVANGRVYFDGVDGRLYALDAADGAQLWRYDVGYPVNLSSPTVFGDMVYAGSSRGSVYAIDAITGSRRWRFDEIKEYATTPTVTTHSEWGPTVYVASNGDLDWALYAVDAEDGTERWRSTISNALGSPPAVTDSHVFVGNRDGTVFGINVDDGSVDWEAWPTAGNILIDGAPTVYDGRVYVTTLAGTVHALDPTDGSSLWDADVGEYVYASPTVAPVGTGDQSSASLYVGTDSGDIVALDAADGSQQWRAETGGSIRDACTVTGTGSDQLVYVGNRAGRLSCHDPRTGSERWTKEMNSDILTAPSVIDGAVLVGTRNGRLWALVEPDHPHIETDPPQSTRWDQDPPLSTRW